MRTYSLMFAYLSNERAEQLTWALRTLKKWMVEKGASLPSVFVSDRDLALINTIETCFPMARHILCIWHINQCVMKKCAPMLGLEWKSFNASWHSLINSSTQWSYQQKWEVHARRVSTIRGCSRIPLGDMVTPLQGTIHSSMEAMEFISGQLKCAEEASHQLAGRCTCSIKIVYGLPCEHDLAHYRYYSIPIPLQSIDVHWRRLSMHVHGGNEEGARQNRTSHVIEILDGMDPHMREHMIDKFFDMADPSQNASTSGSRITQLTTTSRGRGRCGRRSVVRNPPIHDTYIEKLPVDLQRYISHTVDVQPDGHCGFRAIAALIGFIQIGILVATLLFSLNWFEPWAPEMYWMDSMPLGIVIASRYNLVLHTFGENIASCFTHLPLRSPPVPNQERREIAIAHVGNHFVQVFLHPHYPVPPIPTWWWQHSSYEAKGWATRYRGNID
ncbi:hypothetical protein Acr_08g0010100 [Actinidia rufa]|uniref:SWIM-type domain-containing protein n=1 Tax=Actinidia rufa TaxID=165716 RepID=A0A7J0F1R1_9ERIC|nr:hypothetical protein Acr_08g0010100 [Actinidia rufa]